MLEYSYGLEYYILAQELFLTLLIFLPGLFSKVMTWLSLMDFRSSLAAKIKNVFLTFLYSKMACSLDIYPVFSAEEQCFSKAERIQAWIQPKGLFI